MGVQEGYENRLKEGRKHGFFSQSFQLR